MLKNNMVSKKLVEDICYSVIGAYIEVHKELGPGMLESAYESCLMHELKIRGIKAKNQVSLPLQYKGLKLEKGFRIDILVEDLIVVELKAVSQISAVDEAQLISYLNLMKSPKGLLINFNVKNIAQNIVSCVSKYYDELPDQ